MVEDFILQYSQAQRLAFSLSDQLSSSGDLSLSHLQEDKKPEYFYIQQKPAASHSAALATNKPIPAGNGSFSFHTPFFRSTIQELYTFVDPPNLTSRVDPRVARLLGDP